MNAYPTYKPTEYKWLGDIPSHWEWLFLSQACYPQEVKNTGNTEGNVLSLSYGRIIRKKDINFGLVPKDYNGYQIVDSGNIILRLTDLQNDRVSLRTGLVRERGIITSAYTCLAPFQNAEYLQLLLHAYDVQKYFYGLGGGVRQSIGFKDIKYSMIPLPPREEQDCIVRWLNWQTSRIAHYTRAKKREIECLRELRQTIILDTITAKKSRKHTFDKVAKVCSNLVHPESYLELPQISPANIEKNTGRLLPFTTVRESGIKSDNHLFYKGQILYSKIRPLLNKVTIAPFDGLCSADMYPIETTLDIRYLMYYMLSQAFTEQLAKSSNRVKMPKLNRNGLGAMLVAVPLPDEQTRIVAYLDEQCAAIDAVIAKLTCEIELVDEYKASIISEAVTGKIDLRNVDIPDFEPMDEPTNDNEEGMDDEDN